MNTGNMSGSERREKIIDIVKHSDVPVPGSELARQLDVSRQVIVQDIALIRASDIDIISTNRGYVMNLRNVYKKVFKVRHTAEESETEMNEIVDHGGRIRDVFVYHKVYGVIRAAMNISSRKDVQNYLSELEGGVSSPLMKITDDYHYHTVEADSEGTLRLIEDRLWELGFLAKLREHEPVELVGHDGT